jgi:hypothetical protein
MRRDINELQKKMDSMEVMLDTKMDGLKRGDHGSIEKFCNREDT